jgi:hypothetical protein
LESAPSGGVRKQVIPLYGAGKECKDESDRNQRFWKKRGILTLTYGCGPNSSRSNVPGRAVPFLGKAYRFVPFS